MCFSRFEFSHIAATCFFAQPPAPRKLLQRNFQFSELFVLARPLENVTSGPLLFPNPPVVLGKPSSALACINIIFGDTQRRIYTAIDSRLSICPLDGQPMSCGKGHATIVVTAAKGNRNEQPSSKLTAESPSILRSDVRFSGLFFARANEKR